MSVAAHQPKPRGLWEFPLALVASVWLLAMLLIGWMHRHYQSSLLEQTRSEIEVLAQVAATTVDPALHQTLRSAEQVGSAEHLRAIAPLVAFHKATRGVIYVYTMIKLDGKNYFILGSDYLYRVPGDTLPYDPILHLYETEDLTLERAFQLKTTQSSSTLVKEEHRSYLSAYSPIFRNGEFEGILGIDLDAATLESRMGSLDRAYWSVAALLSVLALAALQLLLRRRVEEQKRLELAIALNRSQDVQDKTSAAASLAAVVAHEFSQHLTVATGHLDLSIASHGAHRDREVENAIEALTRANEAVEQMRTLSGSAWTTVREHTLKSLCTGALNRLALRGFDVSRVKLICGTQAAHATAVVDDTRIESALAHVLKNALEAVPVGQISHGEVEMRIETFQHPDYWKIDAQASSDPTGGESWKIAWDAVLPDSGFAIVICDRGPGFDAQAFAGLSRAFFSTKGAGKGLGFAVIKSALNGAGGCLLVKNRVSETATAPNTILGASFALVFAAPLADAFRPH